MSVQMTRWKVRLRQRPMAEQLAQSRRSRRETRHLLSNPVNAARLRESIRQLDQGMGIVVEFGKDGQLAKT
jgi:hypothetical protein